MNSDNEGTSSRWRSFNAPSIPTARGSTGQRGARPESARMAIWGNGRLARATQFLNRSGESSGVAELIGMLAESRMEFIRLAKR
jgi:hypothetical protein